MNNKSYVKNKKTFGIGFAIGSIPFLILIFLEFLKFGRITEFSGEIVLATIFGVISGFLMDNLTFNYSKKKRNIGISIFILLLYVVFFIWLYFWYSLVLSTGFGSFGP